MIRRLTEKDHEACMKLLMPKAAENLFILGDIEAYGYDQAFQKVWGDFDDHGNLRAVLLKYYQNYIPYAPGHDFDHEGLAKVMVSDPEFQNLNGLEDVVSFLIPWIASKPSQIRKLYYAKCRALKESQVNWPVKKAGVEDVGRIMELYRHFSFSNNPESIKRNMEKGVARTYYIEVDGQMVSSASSTAENTLSAMVVGVCTVKEHQKKGMASACLVRLCQDLLQEGKELCLFYDNPDAGRIYERLGFVPIGRWMMVSFQ